LFIKNKHKRIRLLQKVFLFLFTLFSFFALSDYSLSQNIPIDSFSQTINISSDSTQLFLLNNNDDFLNFRMNHPVLYELPDTLFLQLKINFLTQSFSSDNLFKSSLSDQWRNKEQLDNYVQFQNRFAMKSDLGVFGKVLGESKIITALILAILHVIKYKKGLY